MVSARWRRIARIAGFVLVPVTLLTVAVGYNLAQNRRSPAQAEPAGTGDYRLSADFSGFQGRNQWSYQQWDGSRYTDMRWNQDGDRWEGNCPRCGIGRGWVRPDNNQVVIAWTAPHSGKVTVSGTMDHRLYTQDGDGVRTLIKQRSGAKVAKIWPTADYQLIRPNFMAQHVLQVNVRTGDILYFHADQFGDGAYDTLFWDPRITYGLEPKFTLDQAEQVMDPDDFQRMGVPLAMDSMLAVVPHGSDFDFYHSMGGTRDGTVVSKFRGTLVQPARDPVYTRNVFNARSREQWWISTIFRAPDGSLLAFCHIENADPDRYGWWGLGLAYSTDDGASFRQLGWIVGQHVKDAAGDTNISGAPFVIKDGYFYVFYGDVMTAGAHPLPAVARAPVAEVLDAARRGTVSSWRKYFDGGWEEPGLNGNASGIMTDGVFYSMHGDAAYSTYLGRYLLSGFTGQLGRGVFLTFSNDAQAFDPPSWIQRSEVPDKDSLSPYVTIVNIDGTDNAVVGQSFYLYYGYRYRQADVTISQYPALYRWLYRQKVTLNRAGFAQVKTER